MIKRILVVACCALALVATGTLNAFAHVHDTVGRFEISLGWLDEPTFSGFKNGVQIRIERIPAEEAGGHAEEEGEEHAEGTPVGNAKLKVEVIFEDGAEKIGPLDLEPAFGAPGEYHAALIPTRPGVYTFHITGTIGK